MPMKIEAWVILTPTINAVLERLPEFIPEDLIVSISSGLRDASAQLKVISGYAVQHGVIQPEFDAKDVDGMVRVDDMLVYKWQRTWSKLLVVEPVPVIVNPPYSAGCLEHYINSAGVDMFMKLIHQTPHAMGKCFDIRADEDRDDGVDEMPRKVQVIEDAMAAGVAIKSYTIERANNCLHVNCK